MSRRRTPPDVAGELHELGCAAAVRAVRNGEVSSETYVLHAARQGDRSVRAGRSAPLLGVSLAIKDSYLTKGGRTASVPPSAFA